MSVSFSKIKNLELILDDLADLWSISYGVKLTKPNAYKEKGEGNPMLILVGRG